MLCMARLVCNDFDGPGSDEEMWISMMVMVVMVTVMIVMMVSMMLMAGDDGDDEHDDDNNNDDDGVGDGEARLMMVMRVIRVTALGWGRL